MPVSLVDVTSNEENGLSCRGNTNEIISVKPDLRVKKMNILKPGFSCLFLLRVHTTITFWYPNEYILIRCMAYLKRIISL